LMQELPFRSVILSKSKVIFSIFSFNVPKVLIFKKSGGEFQKS